MDLELTQEQQLLEDALRNLFESNHRLHHPIGAVGVPDGLATDDGIDTPLLEALSELGYLDVGYEAGPIEAVLVAEHAAEAVSRAPVTARVLVGPLAGFTDLPLGVGLVGSGRGLVRYAGHCDAYLVLDGVTASLAEREDVDVEPVSSSAGYPFGRVTVRRSKSLGENTGHALRRAWQIGLAAEIGSTALAATMASARHVTDRHQFGRPIGSFQAVQHRLARAYGMALATKSLARRAAWNHDDEFLTASAATFACLTARETYDNVHQVTGAIGITSEYVLVQWTMRLLALQSELGGSRAHARRVELSRRARASIS